ncbi:MAG: hypothetical protein PHH08_00700 [Candidatus ainarchaeum sp.]|nr:hypothetical protein [Candidatus ainarchaeum sp.]
MIPKKYFLYCIILILLLILVSGCVELPGGFGSRDGNQANASINFPDEGTGTGGDDGETSGGSGGSSGTSGGTGSSGSGGSQGSGTGGGTSGGTGSSGSGGSQGSGSDSGGTSGNEGTEPALDAEQARQTIEITLSVENPPVRSLVSALEIAQQAGLAKEEEAVYKKLIAVVQKSIDNTLNNPNSSIRELLEAVELSQQWGLGDKEIMDKVVPKIRIALQARLNNSDFCDKQVLKIAEIAEQLGINDIAAQAKQKAASSGCTDFYYLKEYKSENTTETTEGTVEGYFEELLPFGLVDPITRTYGIKDGKLKWSYDYLDKQRCATTTKTGGGTEELSEMEGQLFVEQNGKFNFMAYKYIEITVKVTPSGSPDCEGEEVQSDSYKEQTNIMVGVADETDNPNYLQGEKTETENLETTKTEWTIKIP